MIEFDAQDVSQHYEDVLADYDAEYDRVVFAHWQRVFARKEFDVDHCPRCRANIMVRQRPFNPWEPSVSHNQFACGTTTITHPTRGPLVVAIGAECKEET